MSIEFVLKVERCTCSVRIESILNHEGEGIVFLMGCRAHDEKASFAICRSRLSVEEWRDGGSPPRAPRHLRRPPHSSRTCLSPSLFACPCVVVCTRKCGCCGECESSMPDLANVTPPPRSVFALEILRASRSSMRSNRGGAAALQSTKSSAKNDSMTSVVMLMVSLFAFSYVAGRLWQDAEVRAQLISIDPSMRRQATDSISVDETLRLIDCKEQQKKLMDAGLELAAAKSQGYKPMNRTLLQGRKTVVVGIFTGFGGQSHRTSSRKTWMPTGVALKELENDKGIIVRFVIGRSSNKGDMLDRQIEQESKEIEDFLILEDHVESDDNLAQKSRLFFSKAVNTWDADFYVKMDDNVGLNIDMMASMLSSHRDKPRVYVGCMKSGMVIHDPNAQWYEPDWWKFGDQKSEYHRHAAGQVYGLSRALALYISINSAYLKEYKNEDVAVGTWVLGLDTEHIDDRNLCCSPNPGAVCWRH